jgi:hypothetical protein
MRAALTEACAVCAPSWIRLRKPRTGIAASSEIKMHMASTFHIEAMIRRGRCGIRFQCVVILLTRRSSTLHVPSQFHFSTEAASTQCNSMLRHRQLRRMLTVQRSAISNIDLGHELVALVKFRRRPGLQWQASIMLPTLRAPVGLVGITHSSATILESARKSWFPQYVGLTITAMSLGVRLRASVMHHLGETVSPKDLLAGHIKHDCAANHA